MDIVDSIVMAGAAAAETAAFLESARKVSGNGHLASSVDGRVVAHE
jgi:hypothetical protein